MKFLEFRTLLEVHSTHQILFTLPDGDEIPAHAHITEVGRTDKMTVDCGGTLHRSSACCLQVWVADDLEHRLTADKLLGIIGKAMVLFEQHDFDLEIEYEDCCCFSQYPVTGVVLTEEALRFSLVTKHTDCLAKEICLPDGGCEGKEGCC